MASVQSAKMETGPVSRREQPRASGVSQASPRPAIYWRQLGVTRSITG